MNMKRILLLAFTFLSTIIAQGQYKEDYTVNITGVPCVVLFEDGIFVDYDNDHGTFYPDDDGVIRISLPPGRYQYIAKQLNMTQGMNGSSQIFKNDIAFEIQMIPHLYGIETEKCNFKAYQLMKEGKKKKARELNLVAAQAGNVTAMFDYARMCYNGIGGKNDKGQAYYWMTEAQKRGNTHAARLIEHFDDKSFWKWNKSVAAVGAY